jgi:hypothetical protein
MTTLREIENLGFCLQDNICVFCSTTYDRWDKFCVSCNEYKGMMNIVSAVGYYGPDILPTRENVRPLIYNSIIK